MHESFLFSFFDSSGCIAAEPRLVILGDQLLLVLIPVQYLPILQFLEWVQKNKLLDFNSKDYASHLDLIAKVHGLQKAENYLEQIPQSFKTEAVYESLLANCVILNDVKKAEEIFKKIKDLSLPSTIYAYNQLLILYRRMAPSKIPSLFKTMEREKVKPSLFSYKLLIDLKGRSKDIEGMEQVLKSMKAEGMAPDIAALGAVTQHYVAVGLGEKAEATLKEIEGDISKNRNVCRSLMSLYASIGKSDEVSRLWQFCQTNPSLEECLAAILAYGKLEKIEDAESVFETMKKTFGRLPTKYYNVMLNLYATHNLLEKGKELIRRMDKDRLQIGPVTLDALIKLYAKAGEVEKADQILEKVSKQKFAKPLYNSFATVLEEYAKKGNVHHAEKIFYQLRQMDFPGKALPYHLLIQAYVKAKVPAYGFRERMKGDDAYMSKQILSQLNAVDAFSKKPARLHASILDFLP